MNEPKEKCCVCGEDIDLAFDQWSESPSGEYMHVKCSREYQKMVDKVNSLSTDEFIDVLNTIPDSEKKW